jgi:hypothetical protein
VFDDLAQIETGTILMTRGALKQRGQPTCRKTEQRQKMKVTWREPKKRKKSNGINKV